MAESSGDKTFEPTAHRRQQAREKGQVAYSQDLGSAALLLLGGFLMLMLGGHLLDFSAGLMRHELEHVSSLVPDQDTYVAHWIVIAQGAAGVLVPFLGLVMLAAVVTNVLQIGFMFTPERIMPDFSHINPLSGLGRIFSLSGAMRLSFGLVKLMIIGIVAGMVLWARRNAILHSSSLDIPQIGHLLVDVTLKTILWVGLALVIVALLDYILQWWKFEKDLKMTHQEVREEMKEMQGDPQIAARRRQVARQMVLNRISSSVPKADVVVTNPTELAVAIQYDPLEMAAPIVVAKGAGVLAQRIRRLALENNIPIVERKPLAQLLYKEVDIGKRVPTESYATVAEVLAYVYQLKGKKVPIPPEVA